MSRIHEALKKAQEERAGVHVTDTAPHQPIAQPSAPAVTAPPAEWQSRAHDVSVDRHVPAYVAPPLGTAPSADHLRFDELRAHCAHPTWRLDPNVNVFFNPSLSSHGAEQFRTLRSRLYQLRATQPLKTLLITSSVPGEGKTFVASNLAQAIVRQPDRRVLLIDGDLRCARLHVTLGAPVKPGLSEYLRGEVDEMSVIQHGQEGNLCLIAGGSEVNDPSELLSNGRLRTLLERVAPIFDWVIFDSPPCLPVADATILASHCEGILLIVRAGMTQSEVAQRACQELSGKNVIGVVMNAVEPSHMYGSYYYQQYGYGYGNGNGNGHGESKEPKASTSPN